VAVLFRCNADGSDLQQLSSGAVTESTPSILPDGRILHTRWEYVNRATTKFHQLWAMNPDGTGAAGGRWSQQQGRYACDFVFHAIGGG
jgi:hypothetical protein